MKLVKVYVNLKLREQLLRGGSIKYYKSKELYDNGDKRNETLNQRSKKRKCLNQRRHVLFMNYAATLDKDITNRILKNNPIS